MGNMKIAISGKIASGKTSLANEIILNSDKKIGLFSFASPIKKIAYECFCMSTDPNLKDRKLLQNIGQKLREIDQDVWVNAFLNLIKNEDNVICDDLRFKNEATTLIDAGFTLVRLNICPELQLERLKNTYPKTWEEHVRKLNNISETDLDNCIDMFDLVINVKKTKSTRSQHKSLYLLMFDAIEKGIKNITFEI